MASVQVIRLPALQVYALDNADPVPTNQNVTYSIRVKNEGDANDEDVKIIAKIPAELKFVSADGPTEFEQNDNEVTFQLIESLSAGDEVEYTMTAQAMKDGNVTLQVNLEDGKKQ